MSCSSKACTETSASPASAITDYAVSPQLTHQSDGASNRSYSELLSGRRVAPDFVVKSTN